MAARQRVQYARTTDFLRGDEAVVETITTRGGIGHCVPERDAAESGHLQQLTRLRMAGVLHALTERASASAHSLLIIFNQTVAAYEGRAIGLGGLPARLRSVGHSVIFSDTSIGNDALDVAAQARQFLFHRLEGEQPTRLATSMVPGVAPALRAAADWRGIDGAEAMAKQIPLLVDEYGVFCADGHWTLIKTATPSLYGTRAATATPSTEHQSLKSAQECVESA
ncbi:hypothetical protein [Ralstonia sp. ASV6]|uniref:hypothetical protein n=1 Tax=Ralstonia sp. ASV6 TaxID=2795124 RepID=UPI0018ECD82E|nr:hypothetical protein [Ralstonia sp. ASV6]